MCQALQDALELTHDVVTAPAAGTFSVDGTSRALAVPEAAHGLREVIDSQPGLSRCDGFHHVPIQSTEITKCPETGTVNAPTALFILLGIGTKSRVPVDCDETLV